MKQIDLSKTVLGIELGSTRIKAALLDEGYLPIASGSFTWENQLTRGVWTYALSDAETGLADLLRSVESGLRAEIRTEAYNGWYYRRFCHDAWLPAI